MANEIRVTAGLSLANGNLSFAKTYSVGADQTTARGPNPGTITVTTTEATVNFGSLSAPRWALFRNVGRTDLPAAVEYGTREAYRVIADAQKMADDAHLKKLEEQRLLQVKQNELLQQIRDKQAVMGIVK